MQQRTVRRHSRALSAEASAAFRRDPDRWIDVGAGSVGYRRFGSGPDVLTRVSMIGNDLALDEGVGVCGKDGQSVPVGVGQPTLKVDALTVGGTAS